MASGSISLIGGYLCAICAANLAVAQWGVAAEIPMEFGSEVVACL